ncbi:hypothetical protein D3C75_649370 [compost metagenome]
MATLDLSYTANYMNPWFSHLESRLLLGHLSTSNKNRPSFLSQRSHGSLSSLRWHKELLGEEEA